MPAAAECTIHVSEPPNRKAIDAGLLNDDSLVSLAEEFPVDQPRCPSAAHRTCDDAHELTSTKEKGRDNLATLLLQAFSCLVQAAEIPDCCE